MSFAKLAQQVQTGVYEFDITTLGGAELVRANEADIIEDTGFRIGMRVRHRSFGVGEVRAITGAPPELNLLIYFRDVGPKKIRSRFVERVGA